MPQAIPAQDRHPQVAAILPLRARLDDGTPARPKGRMARASAAKPRKPPARRARGGFARGFARWLWRGLIGLAALIAVAILGYAFINPPTTAYMFGEGRRLGGVDQVWVPLEEIAPVMARSAVAAEDANFCLHWGLDVTAIRAALDSGTGGASTISQQVVKNVYLWHGRSWVRKVIEAGLTPLVEAVWSKRRILEVYLNIAEFGTGVFGVEAAAQAYFGISAADLSATQAARLAAILPDPQNRSASNPSDAVRRRASQIADGAATIAADGRAACFQ